MEISSFGIFGIVIAVATFFAVIASKFRQPTILGYILAGALFTMLPTAHLDKEQLKLFSELGITLLLFILGLELNTSELKHIGKVAVITGIGQVGVTFGLSLIFSRFLGFPFSSAFYIALGMTFSSTIVVVKLLSVKKELDGLYGRISVGILLVQDLIAIFSLILLTAFGNLGGVTGPGDILAAIGFTLLKGVLVGAYVFLFVKYCLNKFLNWIRNDKEVLFLTVLSWAFLMASFMAWDRIGFSLEIGGLVAGIALSSRFEHLQIESWTKPLRDFFLLVFFVVMGLQIQVDTIARVLVLSLIFSAFILIVKPIVVLAIMKLLGYSRKTSFLVAISIAQISEFSLIVANFGIRQGSVNEETLTLLTLVSGITMVATSYFISHNEVLLQIFTKTFSWLKFKVENDFEKENSNKHTILLCGCHRSGFELLHMIQPKKDDIGIIDFDPRIVNKLQEQGYHAIYGDITDTKLFEAYGIPSARIVISTIPDVKVNKNLLHYVRGLESKPLCIVYANDREAIKLLYDAGADFVVYPHLISSNLLSSIINKGSLTKSMIMLRNKVFDSLNTTPA